MGKRKRGKKNALLSQEEIWDDSALIQSWEDAVEEYKLYHSIQARGGNVEDVLQEEEAREAVTDTFSPAAAEDAAPAQQASVEVAGGDRSPERQDAQETPAPAGPAPRPEAGGDEKAGVPNVPQMALGGGNVSEHKGEGLKNLMMAWYFAGYYTGLYEGQQQQQQPRPNQRS